MSVEQAWAISFNFRYSHDRDAHVPFKRMLFLSKHFYNGGTGVREIFVEHAA